MDPCVDCITCNPERPLFQDKDGNIFHVGNLPQDEWQLADPWQTKTHKGVDVLLYVASRATVDKLRYSPNVFPNPYEFPELAPANPMGLSILFMSFTKFNVGACPYVCVAEVNGEIAGRLFLDRNSNNAIRRNLGAAIIDQFIVYPNFEGQGIGDKLLEFAESLARNNGIRWLEIGAMKAEDNSDGAWARRGTDALRFYIRRGYHEMPLYLTKTLYICYTTRGTELPGLVTPRYGRALVVYKDLNSDIQMDAEAQKQLYQQLVAGIPSRPP
jgi:GNAT superfamily N-acetyltransferase